MDSFYLNHFIRGHIRLFERCDILSKCIFLSRVSKAVIGKGRICFFSPPWQQHKKRLCITRILLWSGNQRETSGRKGLRLCKLDLPALLRYLCGAVSGVYNS